MRSLNTIRLAYIVYTLYTFFVIAVSDYKINIALIGLYAIWLIYIAYAVGFRLAKDDVKISEPNIESGNYDRFFFSGISNWKPWMYILAAAFAWLCTILAGQFYTSRGFVSVISGLFNGAKAYSIYQHYVISANIGRLTLNKIPYILMLVYSTVILFWSVPGLLLSGKKMKPVQMIYLGSVILSYFYFGLARGTNFEMYIIFVLIVYCLLNKSSGTGMDPKMRRRAFAAILVMGTVIVLIFRAVIAARGNVFNYQICTEITYNPDRLFSQTFPVLSNIGLSVFRYFGFGIFTIGMSIDKLVLEPAGGLLAFIVPQGFSMIFNENLLALTRQTVDIGVGWVPDYFSFINTLGLPLTLALFFLLGVLVGRLEYSDRSKLLKDLIGAVVFLEMLSIPVGNFISTSTPNELTILLILLWYLKGRANFSFGRIQL